MWILFSCATGHFHTHQWLYCKPLSWLKCVRIPGNEALNRQPAVVVESVCEQCHVQHGYFAWSIDKRQRNLIRQVQSLLMEKWIFSKVLNLPRWDLNWVLSKLRAPTKTNELMSYSKLFQAYSDVKLHCCVCAVDSNLRIIYSQVFILCNSTESLGPIFHLRLIFCYRFVLCCLLLKVPFWSAYIFTRAESCSHRRGKYVQANQVPYDKY